MDALAGPRLAGRRWTTVVSGVHSQPALDPRPESAEHRCSRLRILVAFDGSEEARRALDEAIRIARDEHARLTIVSVAAGAPWCAFPGALVVPFTRDELRLAGVRDAERLLALARACVPDAVSVTTRVLSGRISTAIVAEASAGGYDLLVTGSRPARLLATTGSPALARALVRRCPVSVLVVRRA
jgi:nucleotide-binding universal stress UspA family protein